MHFRCLVVLGLLAHTLAGQSWDSLNAKGLYYYQHGQYDSAEHYLQKALAYAKPSSEINENYLTTLNNLGFVQKGMGDFPAARKTFQNVMRLQESFYPGDHIEKIEASINLANVYNLSAQYDSCEYYLASALKLLSQATSQKNLLYYQQVNRFFDALINIQNSQASLHYKRGQLNDAIALMEQQLKFIQQTYPEVFRTLPAYLTTLNNLITYFLESGQLSKAKTLSMQYVELASGHPEDPLTYLYALHNLASMYRSTAQYDSADLTWQRALVLMDNGSFKGTELHLSILNNLGEMYFALEEYDAALPYLNEARDLQEKRAGKNPRLYQTTLFNLAECYHWKGDYPQADRVFKVLIGEVLQEIQHNFTYLSEGEKISFYRSQLPVLEAYDAFALEVSGVIPIQKGPDPYLNPDIVKDLYDLHTLTKGLIINSSRRLEQQILASTDESLKKSYLGWESSKNQLAQMHRSDTPDPQAITVLTQHVEALEKSLIARSRQFRQGFIVEPVSWKDIQSKLKKGEAAVEMVRLSGGLVYGALILTPQTKQRPALALVMSTKSKHLEKQFIRQYANAIAFKNTDTISYNTFWEPILATIRKNLPKGSLKRIYFSPDGIYNQINVNTLYNPDGKKYLIDEVDIHQLINTREVVTGAPHSKKINKSATLIGNPTFTTDATSASNAFVPLQGTEQEIQHIEKYFKANHWKVASLSGLQADEATVKNIPSTEVLHVATHGFFENTGEEDASLIQALLSSGIVLAGANNSGVDSQNDGILTAYEAMGLNLDTTNLVVLSACETGLGEFHPGEGVYGLQRAFQSAGARNIIMSLWKVDDAATQQLMTTFYKLWLKQPGDARRAFHQAQRELRKQYPEPYYWGAFVFTGR